MSTAPAARRIYRPMLLDGGRICFQTYEESKDMTNNIINAGIILKEFAVDPATIGAQPLRQQSVACGPTPSLSDSFTQMTRFVELTIGFYAPNGLNAGSAIHYQLGVDPLATLVGN